MDSLWRSTCPLPAFPALHGDITCEAVVVGGGLCGLLCAWFLQEAGIEVIVVEADRILSGATQGTTAKITAQHGLIYDRLIERFGYKAARQYADAQQHAIDRYVSLVQSLQIDCQLERLPAYLYSTGPSPDLERECAAAQRLGLPALLTGAGALPFPAAQALCFEGQAQFHPLRFAKALAERLEIREHSRVTELGSYGVKTAQGKVRAKHVLVCTHYPLRNVPGFYFARMHQARGYVLALSDAPDVGGMWLNASGSGYSLRNAGGLLLLGGFGHRTGDHPYPSSFRALHDAARTFYPGAHEAARWSAQDCITADGVPYIGPYARSLPNVYVATGFNKWGMTQSMVAAELLRDLVLKKKSYPFGAVFRPQRFTGIAGTYHWKGAPKCTHMGCALEWNPDTRTFDCPCHGSRFTRSGRVVGSPATRDGRWE